MGVELLCEFVFRPAAQLLVIPLAALRIPPPAVVVAGAAAGLAAAWLIADGELVLAAVTLQLKTVLDNADGQLARYTNRVTLLGRYLDSESDLVVNAALFAAVGNLTGDWLSAGAAVLLLTAVLGTNFNAERLYAMSRPPASPTADSAAPRGSWLERALARAYELVYLPQDRAVERFCKWRIARAGLDAPPGRYLDALTVNVIANFGLSTQLALLGGFCAAGYPEAYVAVPAICCAVIGVLVVRREVLIGRGSTGWPGEGD